MKYRKKPVVVEAIKWTGNNYDKICKFCDKSYYGYENLEAQAKNLPQYLFIYTLEGKMKAEVGDYIVKGVHGEFYPCKPDIFEETYEVVKND